MDVPADRPPSTGERIAASEQRAGRGVVPLPYSVCPVSFRYLSHASVCFDFGVTILGMSAGSSRLRFGRGRFSGLRTVWRCCRVPWRRNVQAADPTGKQLAVSADLAAVGSSLRSYGPLR